jgi:hypothetical protein
MRAASPGISRKAKKTVVTTRKSTGTPRRMRLRM